MSIIETAQNVYENQSLVTRGQNVIENAGDNG